MSASPMSLQQLQQEYTPELVEYAQGILKDGALETGQAEEDEKMLSELLLGIKEKLDEALLYATPEDKLDELNDLLYKNDEEQLQTFFSQNIPNLEDYLTNVLLEYREVLLTNLANNSNNQ
jgi:phage portal protein BeeE